jgi:hypothetical protein
MEGYRPPRSYAPDTTLLRILGASRGPEPLDALFVGDLLGVLEFGCSC